MLFNSLDYLLFLPTTVLIYYILSDSYKLFFLLLASYIFYFWLHPLSPFILLFTTIIGYVFSIKISGCYSEKNKIRYLFAGIIINLLILIFCREIFKSIIPAVGVSFFTFQNISYLIDSYLGIINPEKNILYYALYISFFPKLLQGPIERAAKLIPQLKVTHDCKYEDLRNGSRLFFWGMFKKVVIADNLSLVVNHALENINGNSKLTLLVIPYFYAIQIYCDFSGYTDMALGSARLFGINLTNNFNYPYFATSIQDFWRRWHITLSSWILDYIFKPLQMKWRNYGNYGLAGSLIITFLICGIWHGLRVNYIIWGLYHGILMSISFLTYKKWQKFCKKYKLNQTLVYIIDVFVTFNLICFSWIIFMTKNLSDVLLILIKNINTLLTLSSFSFDINNLAWSVGVFKTFYIVLGVFLIIELLEIKFNIGAYINQQNIFLRWLIYYVLLMSIILIGNYHTDNSLKFIYFQF